MRKFFPQHDHGAIYGTVVNHNNFAGNVFGSFENGMQALLEKMLNVIVNYDDRELHSVERWKAGMMEVWSGSPAFQSSGLLLFLILRYELFRREFYL